MRLRLYAIVARPISTFAPRVGAASPPKREPIVTPQIATYKGGKPASWLSMLSILCHFHGLLFARQMLDKPICRNVPHSPRDAHRYPSLVIECIGDLALSEIQARGAKLWG